MAYFSSNRNLSASPVYYLLLLQRRVPEARIACLRSDIDGGGDSGSIGARRNANYFEELATQVMRQQDQLRPVKGYRSVRRGHCDASP